MAKPIQCICGSTHIVKLGFKITRKGKTQRYQCADCGRVMLGDII